MPVPVIAPLPTGLGDLALAWEVARAPDEVRSRVDALLATHADVTRWRDETLTEIADREAALIERTAQVERDEDEAVARAEAKAQGIIAKAQAEAGVLLASAQQTLDEAKDDAKARNAKCLGRENTVKAREEANTEVERIQEARAAEMDRKEAELNAREAAVATKEARMRAAAADLAA